MASFPTVKGKGRSQNERWFSTAGSKMHLKVERFVENIKIVMHCNLFEGLTM